MSKLTVANVHQSLKVIKDYLDSAPGHEDQGLKVKKEAAGHALNHLYSLFEERPGTFEPGPVGDIMCQNCGWNIQATN